MATAVKSTKASRARPQAARADRSVRQPHRPGATPTADEPNGNSRGRAVDAVETAGTDTASDYRPRMVRHASAGVGSEVRGDGVRCWGRRTALVLRSLS